jgi:hypothetical protein
MRNLNFIQIQCDQIVLLFFYMLLKPLQKISKYNKINLNDSVTIVLIVDTRITF